MPNIKITPKRRREMVLAALQGERNAPELARRYGISPQRVRQIVEDARRDARARANEAREEAAFYENVARLTGRG